MSAAVLILARVAPALRLITPAGTDAWEAQASAHQDALIEWSSEDRTVPQAVVTTLAPMNNNADHNAAKRAAGEAAALDGAS